MYAVLNKITGLKLKGYYYSPDEADDAIRRMTVHWADRGFPTSPSEFEVVAKEDVPPQRRRRGSPARRAPAEVPKGMVRYPFPLSDGSTASLTLPESLTAQDCERLTAMLTALVVDEPELSR